MHLVHLVALHPAQPIPSALMLTSQHSHADAIQPPTGSYRRCVCGL